MYGNPLMPYQNIDYNRYMNQCRPQQMPQFIARQVTSIDEAKASMIDPFNTYLFIDTSTGRIYLKRMNNNGLSDFYTYIIDENKNEVKADPFSEINQRLINIENKIGAINVKSVSDNTGNAESGHDNDSKNEKSESKTV